MKCRRCASTEDAMGGDPANPTCGAMNKKIGPRVRLVATKFVLSWTRSSSDFLRHRALHSSVSRVPFFLRWSKKGPLSLKPLSSWYLDILERVRRGRFPPWRWSLLEQGLVLKMLGISKGWPPVLELACSADRFLFLQFKNQEMMTLCLFALPQSVRGNGT